MQQPRVRRSQAERSAETRQRLLDAAITLMHERGLAGTSTNDIAEAAGVSRGALTHHFESREELIAAAIEDMLDRVIGELETYATRVAEGETASDDLIEFLYGVMSNRLFYVTLEYLPEARHNAMFRARLVPVVSRWHAALDEIWSELMGRYGLKPEAGRDLLNATMCLIRGMIAQTILRDDPPYYRRLLDFWKASIRAQLAAAAAPPRVVPRILALTPKGT
jgi:AcrR family transcriptional regulator